MAAARTRTQATRSDANLKEMINAFDRYVKEFRLVEVPDDYHVIEQLQPNAQRNQLKKTEKKVPMTH